MEYYDPMLFVCTEKYPNTMGVTATLNENVDGDMLSAAVEELRERFPYFYIKAEVERNDLVPVPNPLPVTIRNTWEPIMLNSRDANFHVMAFKYEGERLALEMSHGLSDGAGMLPYFKSVLYLYLTKKTGKQFDPTGFRLPGTPIPESETGNPFSGADLDSIKRPFYQKPPIRKFYRLGKPSKDRLGWNIVYLRLPEANVMKYCSENDGSPNVLFSVLLARAVRRIDKGSNRTVTSLVALDHKAILGNTDNYRLFAHSSFIDFKKNIENWDISKMCTIGRGQLMLQALPENSLFYLKTMKAGYEKMRKLPLQIRIEIIKRVSSQNRSTVGVSYANSRSFGPLDPYIKELYNLGEPVASDVLCEVTCINHCFFLALSRSFSSETFVSAFLDELTDADIPYDIMCKEPYRLCGVRYDGIKGIKL